MHILYQIFYQHRQLIYIMPGQAGRKLGFSLTRHAVMRGASQTLRKSRDDIPSTMRAVVQAGYGPVSDSIEYARVPSPTVSPFDVRLFFNQFFKKTILIAMYKGFSKGSRCFFEQN